ncbi:TIGR03087 family PEP-CTERM/XrtA system glycosyltransferase [Paraglaciecola sp. 25GB23A]|uniref:TIGR03087 family PEP-CTERM/XrtA system glycosyltransferase n=1 Tax=Paraglaciecola sp. 25GB23A TaxID=3156068 RepID=UPI0032B0080C
MNILIISQRVPFPPNKGEKIRTFHQLQYLAKQGHNITLAAPFEESIEIANFKALEDEYCEGVINHKLPHKIFRLPLALLTGKALSVANFYSIALQKKIDQFLNQNKIDVILCTASSMAEYVFKSKALLNLENPPKLVMDFMDLDSDKWRQYSQRSKGLMKAVYLREANLISTFELKIAKAFFACFFITDAEKDLFLKQHPQLQNIHSVENGIDNSIFKPSLVHHDHTNPIILFTGVMDYPPNIDAVLWFSLHVWPTIIEKWPKAKFIIAGMNPTEKIKDLANLKGIEVTGFVEDIIHYFDQANLFVAPFRIARGVQNKVLQAFACGLPVIASPMGAEGIRCLNGESILLAETPNEFIKQIEDLLNSDSHYRFIRENAITVIQQHYSWDSILLPFEQILAVSNALKTQAN